MGDSIHGSDDTGCRMRSGRRSFLRNGWFLNEKSRSPRLVYRRGWWGCRCACWQLEHTGGGKIDPVAAAEVQGRPVCWVDTWHCVGWYFGGPLQGPPVLVGAHPPLTPCPLLMSHPWLPHTLHHSPRSSLLPEAPAAQSHGCLLQNQRRYTDGRSRGAFTF